MPAPTGNDDQAVFEAVAQLTLSLSRRVQIRKAAFVLLLDDAHWLDVGSRDLLRYLLRRWGAEQAAVCLVLAVRAENRAIDPSLAQWLGDLQREAAFVHCLLEVLGVEAVQTLTQSLLDLPQSAKLGTWLFTTTEGQPFYLTEMVRELIERHEIIRDATGKLALSQPDWAPSGNPPPISRTLHEVIQLHVSRVQPTTQRFLQAAAILGDHFTFTDVCAIADIAAAEIGLAALEESLAQQLVQQISAQGKGYTSPQADYYAFRHDLIREVTYQGVSAARRRWLHEQALRVLQTQGAPPAILAHHALAAHLPAAALQQSILAGESALAVLAIGDAIAHLEQARQIFLAAGSTPLGATVTSGDLINLHITLARAYELADRWDDARQVYEALRAIGRATQDRRMEVMALNHHASLLMQQRAFDLSAAIALLEEALQRAEDSHDQMLIAETEWSLCQATCFGWDVAAAIQHGQRAKEFAQAMQYEELAARSTVVLGSAFMFAANFEAALQYSKEGTEEYTQLIRTANDTARGLAGTFAWGGMPPTPLLQLRAMEVSALIGWGFAALNLGQIRESKAVLQQAHETALAARNELAQVWADLNLPHAMIEAGDYEAALQLVRETYAQPFQELHYLVTARHNMMLCLIIFGRFAEAQTLFDEALAFSQPSLMHPHRLLILSQGVMMAVLVGDWSAAVQRAHEAMDIRQRATRELWWIDGHRHLETRALLRAGDESHALQQIQRVMDEVGTNPYQYLILLRMRAEVARHDGALTEGMTLLQEALTLAQGLEMARAQWQILVDMAGLLHEQGVASQATAALTQAEAIIDQLASRISDLSLQADFRATALVTYQRCF